MALRKIEHLYVAGCRCGARASRRRWRLIGAFALIGIFTMAAVGHDGISQAATSLVVSQPQVASPASIDTAAGRGDGVCNAAVVAGQPDPCQSSPE